MIPLVPNNLKTNYNLARNVMTNTLFIIVNSDKFGMKSIKRSVSLSSG